LLVVVRRALDHQRLRTEHRYLLSERDEQFDHYGIIGRSKAMEEVIRRAELVAATKSTVLITGETGTGKELVARAIHDRSARRDDIPALVDHFVQKHAHRTGRRIEKMEDGVLASLQQYDWPGNVRELENTIERAVVLSPGSTISPRAISVIGALTTQTTSLP